MALVGVILMVIDHPRANCNWREKPKRIPEEDHG
jgi:hypothetical protein